MGGGGNVHACISPLHLSGNLIWDPFPLKFSKMEPYMYMYVVEWKYASHAVFE